MQRCFGEMPLSERIKILSSEKGKSQIQIGREYGMAVRNINRYLRCGKLIPKFKDMLDDGRLTIIAGVELSYLSEAEQSLVEKVLWRNGMCIGARDARRLREVSGAISEGVIESILGVDKPVETSEDPVSIRLPGRIYGRFFGNVPMKDVEGIVEKALEQYYNGLIR